MKQHINFLSLYNYKNFGKYLRHNGINLIFAAAMFGLKKENLSYPYFHGVLLSYYSSVESMDDIFEECLNLCNSHEIRRIALAQLIADIDGKENRYENNKNKLKILALKHIGLPENDNAWILSEAASFDSKEKIKKAREILRRWITQQYIDVVFNELMNDKRRADFWKQFAGCIDNFKVVGGDNVRTIINTHLKNTNTQAHYLYAKSPKRYRDFTALAAFIMWIGNRIFIEFSDTANALYVYSEQIWKTISWSEIPELKKQEWKRGGHMLNAYNNAGRFLHSGNWEYRLKSWLKLKLGVFPDSEKRR